MKLQHEIESEYLEFDMGCPECEKVEAPDIIMHHLVEQHEYSAKQAYDVFEAWKQDYFTYNEDGEPMLMCTTHGYYPAFEGCWGCVKEDEYDDPS